MLAWDAHPGKRLIAFPQRAPRELLEVCAMVTKRNARARSSHRPRLNEPHLEENRSCRSALRALLTELRGERERIDLLIQELEQRPRS